MTMGALEDELSMRVIAPIATESHSVGNLLELAGVFTFIGVAELILDPYDTALTFDLAPYFVETLVLFNATLVAELCSIAAAF